MKVSTSFLLWATALPTIAQAQTQAYFTNTVNERAVSCPEDPNQIGYKHVTDINVDQQSELDRIANGEPSRAPYVFPFCNSFKFLMEQEVLQVLLDDITFVCGYNGLNSELCVLEGGAVQVNIPENSANKKVVFQGMSFFGFSGISIKAYGGGSSKLTVNDGSWKNFVNGATAIHQVVPSGGVPMEVEVNKATFENGTGADLFDNVGGILNFDDMKIIETVRVDSMIRTSARGTSRLAKVDATASDLTRLTHTTEGSTQTVTDLNVYGMTSLGSIMYVEGSGSKLEATNVNVKENKLLVAFEEEKTSRNFNVLIATDSSTATIKNCFVLDNDGVDRVFSANSGANVIVHDATVNNNIGTQPPDLLSNIAMAEDGGSMNVLRLSATNIEGFSAAFFAICGSSIQVKQSCVIKGQLSAPVFVSSDSTFISEGNYMDVTNLNVARCLNDLDASVFSETSIESQCFSTTGTGACNGQCVGGFTEAENCLAGNGEAGFALSEQPASGGGGNGNPSCPASPPTPMPTLPPGVAGGGGGAGGGQGGGAGGDQPAFTATIPPGNPGAPGSSPAGSPGSNNGGSGSGGDGGSGGGSGAATFSRTLPIGAALLLAALVHRLLG